jgi:hypothetical protein
MTPLVHGVKNVSISTGVPRGSGGVSIYSRYAS